MGSLLDVTNIIVMGILTFMVFWATRSSAEAAERAARAAEASNKLSLKIFEYQQNERRVAAEIRKKNIIYLMEDVLKTIDVEQGELFNVYEIKSSPLEHHLSSDELATHFKMEEANLIVNFWREYQKYINKHWKTSTGHWIESHIDWQDTAILANESIKLHDELLKMKRKLETSLTWNN